MRPADARFSASTMISSSIRLSLVGAQVDCSTKQSLPRTFSSISTFTSPSENRPTVARPSGMLRRRTTSAASLGFALPVKTIKLSYAMIASDRLSSGAVGRSRAMGAPLQKQCGQAVCLPVIYIWLGRKDSNLRMPESKSGALTSLATPQEILHHRHLGRMSAKADVHRAPVQPIRPSLPELQRRYLPPLLSIRTPRKHSRRSRSSGQIAHPTDHRASRSPVLRQHTLPARPVADHCAALQISANPMKSPPF